MARDVEIGVRLRADQRGFVRSMTLSRKELAQLNREMSRADRQAVRTDRSFAGFSRRLGSIQTLMAGIATGAAVRLVRSQLQAADAIGKASQTAAVSTDQLQELRFALGQLAGTTDRDVDLALQRFNRRLGLARDGSKEYRDVLEGLGIELRQETGPALEQTLRRLSQIESDADRAAAASRLFGEEAGPKLAAALGDGGRELDNLRERARELGIVLEEDFVRQAERINDQFDVASRVLSVQFQQAVIGVTPLVVDFAEALGKATRNWAEFLGLTEGASLRNELDVLRRQRDEILEVRAAAVRGSATWQEYDQKLQAVNARMLEAQRRLQGLASAANGAGGGGGRGGPLNLPGVTVTPGGAVPDVSGLEGVSAPPGFFGTSDEDAERIGRNLDEFRAGVDAITEAQRRMGEAGRDATLTLLDGLNRAIVAGDSFREVLAGVLSQLSRMAVNNPSGLGSLITTGLGALGGGGFNAGASVRAVGTSGQLAGLATGGSFMVGGSGGVDSQLVAFRASPNERVTVETPGQQRGGGGMKIEQHIHIAAGNGDQALAALVERAAERGGRRGYELMAQDITHGGPLGKRLR